MRYASIFILCLWAAPVAASAMSVALQSSLPDGTPPGSLATWTATVADANPGTIWTRFRARAVGSDFRTIVDYGPNNLFNWAVSEREGLYEIEAAVRNLQT